MRIFTTDPLFAWDRLEDCPSLAVVSQLLDLLEDQELLVALRAHRQHGRNDYPMYVLWRVHLLRYFLRHPTMEACLAELRRNPMLRKVAGISNEESIPKPCNMSRFAAVLGMKQHSGILKAIFGTMIQKLGTAVQSLGAHTAGDSTALASRVASTPAAADAGLPAANGGRKEYVGDDDKVVRVFEWFGFKMHLLVDVKHEVIRAYEITSATTSDAGQIPTLLAQAQANLPPDRIQSMAYDKAADDLATHQELHRCGIHPVIQNRNLWKNQKEMMLPNHDGNSNIVFDEAGTLYCYDKQSDPPVKRAMTYAGHEAERGTLKYRCPARAGGFRCPSEQRCNGEKLYGLTVRVKQETDLRRFPPIPRATKTFTRMYKKRTAVERVNARLKLFWGADDGNTVGSARFHAHVGTIMVVHAAVASYLGAAPRYEGRSYSPVNISRIAEALRRPARDHQGALAG